MATPRVRLEGQTDAEAEEQARQDAATAQEATTETEEAPAQEATPEVLAPRFGEHDGVDEILCLVPKPIRLVLEGDGSHTPIDPGLQKLPRAVAEHWWCKVNGVTAAPQ